MAADIMVVAGSARLTSDPLVNDAGNFMRMRLAFTSRTRGDDGWEDKSNFITAVMFGERAAKLAEFIGKGSMVFIQGELEMDTWEDNDGNERNDMRIIIRELVLPPRARQDDEPRSGGRSGGRSSRGGDEGGWR